MDIRPGDKFMNVHNVRRYECEVIIQADMSVKQLSSVLQVNDLCVWESIYTWIEHLETTGSLGRIIHRSTATDCTNIHIKDKNTLIKVTVLY